MNTGIGVANGGADCGTTCRTALELWLKWSEANDRLTTRLFEARDDQALLETVAEEVEQLRRDALAATYRALGEPRLG